MKVRSISFLLACACLLTISAQVTPTSPDSQSTDLIFHVTSNTVILDVVVTDKDGRPVLRLTKDQFHVFEDKKPQTVSYFEAHIPAAARVPVKNSSSPPGSFANGPSSSVTGPTNVLLFDSLNTPLSDQSYVHQQLVKFLEHAPAGQPIALFATAYNLHLVHAFTTDPSEILRALQNHRLKLDSSPLLRTSSELDSQAAAVSQMQQVGATDSAAALQEFQQQQADFEQSFRISTTLGNLEQLALYLRGVRGRKNVIWLSGSFPAALLPDSNSPVTLTDARNYSEEIRRMTNLMTASEISLYPIDGRGVMVDPTVGDAALTGRRHETLNDDRLGFSRQLNLEHESMEIMAHETGGIAFINTNGIAESVARSVNDGASYYSIAYTPTNKADDGGLRKIEIKLAGVKANLAYRRSYFARDAKKPENPYTVPNSLDGAMLHGLPPTSQIGFTVQVTPAELQPTPSEVANESKKFKTPPARYHLDYLTKIQDFTFNQTSDGLRHGTVVVAAIAYGPSGDVLNSFRRSLSVSFNPQQYQGFLASGMQVHESLDLPVGEVSLRTGIYDPASEKVGTLEVPLVLSVPDATKPVRVDSPAQPPAEQPEIPVSKAISGKGAETAPSPTSIEDLALQGLTDAASVSSYCQTAAGEDKSANALASVCEFALSLPKKIPNVVYDREMRRHSLSIHDTVTATVRYIDGREHFSNVRIDGKPADEKTPASRGSWSGGEFAPVLETIFSPLSHAEFKFKKTASLHKVPTLIFGFRVKEKDNRLYSLHAVFPDGTQSSFFPAYEGTFWLNESDYSLVRLERKTTGVGSRFSPSEAVTVIDYARIPLGDGTDFILATNADVLTCSPGEVECDHNVVKFTNWRKYGAKSRILATGDEQK